MASAKSSVMVEILDQKFTFTDGCFTGTRRESGGVREPLSVPGFDSLEKTNGIPCCHPRSAELRGPLF